MKLQNKIVDKTVIRGVKHNILNVMLSLTFFRVQIY